MSDADLIYTQSRNTQPDAVDQALARQVTLVEAEQPEAPENEVPFVFRAATEFRRGVVEGVKQITRSGDSILDALDIPSVLQIVNPETGEFDLDLLTREEAGEEVTMFPQLERPEGFVEALARGTGQFLAGFAPAFRALQGLSAGTKAVTAGAIADAFAFDPFEERLGNLAQDLGIENVVTDFLAASPEDTEAEGRFKNAIEGAILGKIGETLTRLFIAGVRTFKGAKRAADVELEAKKELAGVEAEVEGEIEALKRIDEKVGTGNTTVGPTAANDPAQIIDPIDLQGLAFDPVPDKAVNINLNRIEAPDDIKNLIDRVGKNFEGDIQKARRETITLEQTEKLADDLGLTVEQLLIRRRGEAFNAEQAVAARKILVSSAAKVKELAQVAQSSQGSKEDQIAFLRALSIHKAIQEQVSGAAAEAGRALSSFRIRAGEVDLALRDIPVEDMAKAIADQDTLVGINAVAKQMDKATTSEQLLEAWINGLLSNPVTHTVNVTSNALVNLWAIPDRLLAAGIGKVLGGQEIATGEVVSMLRGLKEGYKDGLTLGWKALKTGDVEDPLTKLDVKRHKAIPGDVLDFTGIGGRAADFLQEAVKNPKKGLIATAKLPVRFGGEIIRLPGRALTAGDVLFKAVNYRMELNALAFRQARLEGLEGREMAERMVQIINDPPENIVKEATQFSRVQTFTNELGSTGRGIQAVANSHPAVKLILPFVRTPTNIVKMVGTKSPLAPFAKSVREDILAGGARRDLALAKMATGSMIMTVAAAMAAEGRISGGGSSNPNIRNLQRGSGWQPYSVNIGGQGKDATWVAYNRLDPIGMTIGLAADYSEIIGNIDEPDALAISSALVMSTAKNLSSKTYLNGLSDFLGAIDQSTVDPDKENRSVQRFIQRLAGSVVPAGVAQVERIVDPTLRDADGIIQQIKSRVPGFGEDLPARLNLWGEEIILDGGLGPDIISPLYVSFGEEAAISDEMVRLQLPVGMPSRSIKGVKLTTQEYHDFVKLTAETGIKSELESIIELPEYEELTDGPEGSKAAVIRSLINRARSASRDAIIRGDDSRFQELRIRIREKEIEGIEALGGS